MHRSPLAILSDIHSNLDALLAVMEVLDAEKIDNVVCLGDIVGYAAYPNECVNFVRKHAWPTVRGNHDDSLDDSWAKEQMNDVANAGIRFAEENLTADNRAWIESLPLKITRAHAVFTHASLDSTEEWPYLVDVESALLHFRRQRSPLCFVGHTHRPMILNWLSELEVITPGDERVALPDSGKATVNVGSVGQPRDGDPRACFALYYPKTNEVAFRRVEYDVKSAQHAIRAAGLPSFAASRLAKGL